MAKVIAGRKGADGIGFDLERLGVVYSFTTMYNVPHGYAAQKPYTVALVQLDDGPVITAQLTDIATQDVHIGMRVEMVTRKLREESPEGQIIYGYKFRPPLAVNSQ